MSTQIDKATEAAGDSLPAYTEAAPAYTGPELGPAASSSSSSAPEAPPPDYRQASFTPYVPIPAVLYGMNKTAYRGLYLCTEQRTGTKLFYAEFHSGLSGSGLLRSRAGVHLHNGVGSKSPVLAAAGRATPPLTVRESFADMSNVVLLPPPMPLASGAKSRGAMTMVMMDGGTDPAGEPFFRLRLDVGTGPADKLRPARFGWCKIRGKAEEERLAEGSAGGFKLVRKLFRAGEKYVDADAPRADFPMSQAEMEDAAVDGEPVGDDGEVVAVLSYSSGVKSWGRLFKLEMRGSAAAGLLGERCSMMVVATALQIYYMHMQGKTNKTLMGFLGGGEAAAAGGDGKGKKKSGMRGVRNAGAASGAGFTLGI